MRLGKSRAVSPSPIFWKEQPTLGFDQCLGLLATFQQSASLNTDLHTAPGELNVVPPVLFGVFYSQERGLSWLRLKCISKGVSKGIMQ